jgi:hypothetical protein
MINREWSSELTRLSHSATIKKLKIQPTKWFDYLNSVSTVDGYDKLSNKYKGIIDAARIEIAEFDKEK